MKTKSFGILAALLLIGALLTIAPASANVRYYPVDWKVVDYVHIGYIYNLPYNANYRPYIGGVNQAIINKYMTDHTDPQKWDLRSYGTGKTLLLVPRTYQWYNGFSNSYSQIYLEIYWENR